MCLAGQAKSGLKEVPFECLRFDVRKCTCDFDDAVQLVHGGGARKDGLSPQQLPQDAPCCRISTFPARAQHSEATP